MEALLQIMGQKIGNKDRRNRVKVLVGDAGGSMVKSDAFHN